MCVCVWDGRGVAHRRCCGGSDGSFVRSASASFVGLDDATTNICGIMREKQTTTIILHASIYLPAAHAETQLVSTKPYFFLCVLDALAMAQQ